MAVINPFQNNNLNTGSLERGLAGLGNLAVRQQAINEQEAAKEAQALKQQELLNVLESDDLMAQRSFLAANPEYAKQFTQAMDFANEATQQNLVDSSIRILQGEDPYEVIRDRAAFVSRAGGSPADTLAALEDSPEEIMRAARFNVSAYGTPQQAEAVKAPKIEKGTTLQQNLKAAGLEPGTKEYQEAVLEYIKKPSGTTVTIGDAKTLEKATEGQLAAAGFANRLADSNKQLSELETKGYDPTSPTEALATRIPGGNYFLSDEAQVYDSAKQDFITAVLRKESGAAIGQDEFEREDKKYFPQPGDSEKLIETKRKRRERQFDVLKKQSKGVYDVQYGEQEADLPPLNDMTDEQLKKSLGL